MRCGTTTSSSLVGWLSSPLSASNIVWRQNTHFLPASTTALRPLGGLLRTRRMSSTPLGWPSAGSRQGAHLALLTLICLRDADEGHLFQAASLMYGCFDLSLTPSMRRAVGTLIIDRARVEALVSGFRGAADLSDPALSPLYADLAGLPPALISVGTLDPLMDDSPLRAHALRGGRHPSELAVYPGGVHGFNFLGGPAGATCQLASGSVSKARPSSRYRRRV